MTQTLYRYRPASLWALVRLIVADEKDRQIARDTRNALCSFFRMKKPNTDNAQEAVESAYTMLNMFPAKG